MPPVRRPLTTALLRARSRAASLPPSYTTCRDTTKTGDADLTIWQSKIYPQIKDGNAIPRGEIADDFWLEARDSIEGSRLSERYSDSDQNIPGPTKMKMNETTQYLKSLGWSIKADEVGDKRAKFSLLDRVVSIIYDLDRIRDQQKFGAMLSVSTEAFSKACSAIRGERPKFYPLITAWSGPDIRAPEILERHIRQASDEAIAWAQDQDLEQALRDHAALPTNAPGARPIWHLAALALLGEVTRLKSYQSSFEAGDRLGFVNYVTKDYINRAVSLAERATDQDGPGL
ncbi:DUF6990 domain-containing protein [Sinorhizobium meliloti]|uniref:DUF6990 domain-containing protein n=1 Tax=Rhizobium meliloti TaxID=382 RepID=UPI001F37B9C6|nr:hypothetical protein [Sinorhizobium meliloti]